MERINQYSFYDLGQAFNKLQKGEGDVAANSILIEIFTARGKIDGLIAGEPIALGVSRALAQQLSSALHSFFNRHIMTDADDGSRKLSILSPTS